MCTAVTSAGTIERMELEVGGETRQFTLFTPSSYDPAVPMPLVFGLHGFTVDAGTHLLVTQMNRVAEAKGVLAVYPQAVNNDWFPGHVPGNNIDYLLEVYEATVANRNVNKEIVALSGLSQGAAMSLTLAAAKPDLFSSVVSVAGTRFFTSDDELVPPAVPEVPARPISRLHVHGTSDSLSSDEGGQVLDFPLFIHSVMDSVTTWAAGLGSEGEPTVVPIDDRTADGLTSELLAFEGRTYVGLDGTHYTADTHYVRVSGGGHNWPGDWNGWPADFQPVTTDFSTSEMAIDFILSHPREYVVGDFIRDGALGSDDVDALVGEIVAGTNESMFDLTADGAVNSADLDQWLSEASTHNGFSEAYLHGDSNLDGSVDATDLNNLALSWQQDVERWSGGDFDADGRVDVADLNKLALNWRGSILAAAADNSPVPEPSTLFLTVVGLTLACRRSRSSATANVG